MQPLFTANAITVKFSGQLIFNHLNFTVNKREHWAVVGKSGAGKTLLLNIIAGNINVNGGSVVHTFTDSLQTKAEGTLRPFHHYIAFVGAKHHFKNLSNISNLYYQQRYNSSDSEDALTTRNYLGLVNTNVHQRVYWTFEKTIAALDLAELLDKQIIKLSNGETKRLMIAAALLKNPVLLLLDNPMTGLDAQTRVSFNSLLNEIASSGITLIITAPGNELPDAITNVAILNNGNIACLTRQSFEATKYKHLDAPLLNITALTGLINTPKNSYNSIISITNVVVKYESKVVLNKVNWQVNPGERWALLGPNGSGKSTLLSLINGDNPQAYANNIKLFDKKRGTGESIWDIKSKIGFVSPELYQYFPADNTCLQVIESGFYDTLGLFRQSSKTKSDVALKWMQALEIEQYAHKLLKNIPASTQRLGLLARALVKNPPLLIFDEPCQGMDEHQQMHFIAVVDAICSLSPVTLIYVTHYPQEIPNCVDKVLRLDKGIVLN